MRENVRAVYQGNHDSGRRFLVSGRHKLPASSQAAPVQLLSSEGMSWNTQLIIVSESSRFMRIYSFFEMFCCFNVISRNIQGEDVLQHQARLPKQVCLPSSRGVPFTVSSFNRIYSSFGRPIRES